MVEKKLNDLFNQMNGEERIELESKTDDNLVKLPFKSELGNPIYVPEDSELKKIYDRSCSVLNLIPLLKNHLSFRRDLENYFPREFSAESITEFSKLLSKNIFEKNVRDEEIGILLNHLIQNSPEHEHLIFTEYHDFELNSFGYRNVKDVTVEGNLGNLVGYEMRKGTIHVNGDVGNYAGYSLLGGTIRIEGNLESLSPLISGGNIYHKDKQIVKKGKILDRSYLR